MNRSRFAPPASTSCTNTGELSITPGSSTLRRLSWCASAAVMPMAPVADVRDGTRPNIGQSSGVAAEGRAFGAPDLLGPGVVSALPAPQPQITAARVAASVVRDMRFNLVPGRD